MKTIVITGGSDGLGREMAKVLCEENKVVILSRDKEKLKGLADELGCDWAVCDVTDHTSVESTMSDIASKYGQVDVVINNAGIIVNGELAETKFEDIYNVINTNTIGSIFVAKASLIQMQKQKSGLLINVISQSGINTRPNRSVYNASKWAITGMTKALQQEVAKYGVRVTGFYPGTIETDFFKKAGLEMTGPSITVKEATDAILYIVSTDEHVLIPELGIKHYERLI